MVRQMAASLTAAGVETHVAATNDNGPGLLDVPLGRPVNEGAGTYWYFPRQSRFYTASWPLASWLSQRTSDYDVVHIHALFSFASLPASHCAHRDGVPYIVRPLGTLNEWGMTQRRPWMKRASYRLIESRIVHHAAYMHYTSEAELEEANRWTNDAPSVVIANPIAEPAHSPKRGAFKARRGVDSNRPLVLFLSRLDEKKGVDLLLQSFAQLRRRDARALLVIAGGGAPEFVDGLRRQAASLGLTDQDVIWTGFLAGDDKHEALADADVFILPSYSENFGIAVGEAMAACLPVVVSDRVAVHRDISAAGAGVVVPCDATALAAAIERLLKEPTTRVAMGERGRDLVRRRYSTSAVTAQIIDVYNQAVSRAPRAAARADRFGAVQGHA